MQVSKPSMQHRVMIEAVENHMPEVIIVDEIGTEAEVHSCRSIAERGVMLIGTAHGERLENIIKNPTLSNLVSFSPPRNSCNGSGYFKILVSSFVFSARLQYKYHHPYIF